MLSQKPARYGLFVLLSLLASGSIGLSSATGQVEGVDLALVINGSGSISPVDFQLQKDGIKSALQDPLILPRDGTVAVTIIQYADALTQVHVPYTVINNSTIAGVIAQVDGIVQIGGLTNPGDGINTANDVFNGDGNPTNVQTICLSTDGLPNAGADVASALNNARSSAIGLDRFTVIAIEDPPFFFARDFHDFYDPLVFGGGVVTVVQDSVDFANSVGGCLTRAIELVGLEVNQAVQDWNNSVLLIERKRTYVRAHIQTIGDTPTRVFARLHGTRDGNPLPGTPLTVPSIVAEPGAADRRGDLEASLNFRLPAAWLNGTVELRLETVGSSLDCTPAAAASDECVLQIAFQPVDRLEMEFIAVEWTDADGNLIDLPVEMFEVVERLRGLFPLGFHDIDLIEEQMAWAGSVPPHVSDVTDEVWWMRFADFCWGILGCDRIYYGVIPQDDADPPEGFLGVADDIPGTAASGYLPADPFVLGRETHAHEIGHTLGRHHAVFDLQLLPPRRIGACGEHRPHPLHPSSPTGPMFLSGVM